MTPSTLMALIKVSSTSPVKKGVVSLLLFMKYLPVPYKHKSYQQPLGNANLLKHKARMGVAVPPHEAEMGVDIHPSIT